MWVYHAPSAGTRLCKTGAAEHGDSDLAEWIDRWHPEMVICGHISTRRHGLTVGVGSIDADGPGCSSRVRRPHRFIGQACITQLVIANAKSRLLALVEYGGIGATTQQGSSRDPTIADDQIL